MVVSFILCLACLVGIVYLFKQVRELLNEIDDNIYGDR